MNWSFKGLSINMKNLILLAGLVLSIGINAQIPEGLNLTFSSSDVKKLERSLEDFNEAKGGYDKAVSAYESVPKLDTAQSFDLEGYYKKMQEALDILLSASEDYHEASKTVYAVYKDGADAFWKEQEEAGHVALGLEKAKYLEVLSKKNISDATMKRALAQDSPEFQEALSYINEANTLEALALRDQARALQIYQDFPVEYEYGWDDDIDIEKILAEQEAARQERNEKLFGKHKVITKEKEDDQATVDRSVVEEEPAFEGEIIYRIQIAAHTTPLEMDYLKGIYTGGKEIQEVIEDNWYKYHLIDEYRSFKSAANELKKTKVKTAFIVAYHDGNRINVKEARKWAP